MGEQVYVTVESVKNPSVKRRMTLQSAKFNAKKWRIAGTQEEPVKKKDVGNVVNDDLAFSKPASTQASEVHDDLGNATPDNGFAKIEDVVVEDPNIDNLRLDYAALSGKQPDGRWKIERIVKEIEALKNPSA